MDSERRNDVIRAVCAGISAPFALAVGGWPSSAPLAAAVGLFGAVAGLYVAFFIEHALEWRAKAASLDNQLVELERQLESDRKLHKLLEHRTRIAQAEAGINAIHMKVYSDAFLEAQKTGHFLPLSAILARVQVMQKAQGLDKPVPPAEGV